MMSKNNLGSRRFVIAIVGILSCLVIGLYLNDSSVVSSIAIICASIAGAAAVDGFRKKD